MPALAVMRLQELAGNRAVIELLAPVPAGPEAAFAHATSGPGEPLPERDSLEAAFGRDLSGVRAHLGGGPAREGLAAMGARAATSGTVMAFRDASPSRELLAHEVAHVVQQAGASGGASRALSDPGSAAEREAERAGHAVGRGERPGDIAPADAGIMRATETTGGTWTTPTYSALNTTIGGTDWVGATIELHFTPNDMVEASKVGLTQTVKTFKTVPNPGPAGGTTTTPSNARTQSDTLTAGEGDVGRGVDRTDYTHLSTGAPATLPNTNPMYGVYNTAAEGATPQAVSAALGDTAPSGGANQFGSHTKNADKTWNAATDAILSDQPRRKKAAGQWYQTFEVAALALDGPLSGMFLGSINWGWNTGTDGISYLMPPFIVVDREGAPSLGYSQAAKKWNSLSVTDSATGTAYPTVDLPVPTKDLEIDLPNLGPLKIPMIDDPGDLPTTVLMTRSADLKKEVAGLPEGPNKVRKSFELASFRRELVKRKVKIAVTVKETDDVLADDVYVELKGPSKKYKTPVKKMDDGDSHDFMVYVMDFVKDPELPLADPVQIEAFDEDLVSADDKIVSFPWAAPYSPARNPRSMDGASYDVEVSFEK